MFLNADGNINNKQKTRQENLNEAISGEFQNRAATVGRPYELQNEGEAELEERCPECSGVSFNERPRPIEDEAFDHSPSMETTRLIENFAPVEEFCIGGRRKCQLRNDLPLCRSDNEGRLPFLIH